MRPATREDRKALDRNMVEALERFERCFKRYEDKVSEQPEDARRYADTSKVEEKGA